MDKYGAGLQEKLKDPVFFINNVIGFRLPPYKLTPYQEEWIRLIGENDRLNLMCFRTSGKTEALLVDYPIFKSFTHAGWQGIVTSKSFKQSIGILRRIREGILGNEILRTSVPDNTREAVWSKTELQLKNGSIIWAKPNNENIVSEHVDWIGCDETGYWKDMDVIEKYIPPMVMAKQGKVVCVGTPTSDTDMIHQLMKNQAYTSRAYPVSLKFNDKETLWELRYPKRKMSEAKKEYGSLAWSREFMLKPLSSKDKIYPYDLLKSSFDYDAKYKLQAKHSNAYYIGLDFALSGETGADYTVYTVLEKSGDVCRLVNMERYKGLSYQAQKGRIVQLAEIFKPIKIIADKGSFGEAFIQDIRSMGYNVEPFQFTNESKQNLHTSFRNMFEQNRIIMNMDEDDPKTKQISDQLLKEFDKFGVIVEKGTVKFMGLGEHDDMVTSFALAAWAARGTGTISWHVERGLGKGGAGLYSIAKVN